MHWKSHSYSFHIRLKVIQYNMEHVILLLVIVAMDKEGFALCFVISLSIFVVEEEG